MKTRLATIKFRKNAKLEMKQNEELATFLANEILFINEVLNVVDAVKIMQILFCFFIFSIFF